MSIANWMSWEGGVDLCAVTAAGAQQPNVIVHVARMVHTPVGSAPAGMLLYQPDPTQPPALAGFVCENERVGAYFGPHIFAGTPFEQAPVIKAAIEIEHEGNQARSRVEAGGHIFETTLSNLTPAMLVQRHPAPGTPFIQQGLEHAAGQATLTVDGKPLALSLPPAGLTGGPAAVWAPTGLYAR